MVHVVLDLIGLVLGIVLIFAAIAALIVYQNDTLALLDDPTDATDCHGHLIGEDTEERW